MNKAEKIKLRFNTAQKTINRLADASGYGWAITAEMRHQWALGIVNDQEAALPSEDDA